MIIIIIAIIAIIIILIIVIYKFYFQNLKILTATETKKFLLLDSDNYVHNFNSADLIARNAFSINDYIQTIINSTSNFTKKEIIFLNLAVKQANKRLLVVDITQKYKPIWNFAKTISNKYENGYPHTRKNIIFISSSFFDNFDIKKAVKTIIHEQIHIFQRNFPELVNNYLFSLNYTLRKWPMTNSERELKRSNPDINNSIWIDPLGKEMLPLFNSLNPSSMNDLITEENHQHPYETMAYLIENL